MHKVVKTPKRQSSRYIKHNMSKCHRLIRRYNQKVTANGVLSFRYKSNNPNVATVYELVTPSLLLSYTQYNDMDNDINITCVKINSY